MTLLSRVRGLARWWKTPHPDLSAAIAAALEDMADARHPVPPRLLRDLAALPPPPPKVKISSDGKEAAPC